MKMMPTPLSSGKVRTTKRFPYVVSGSHRVMYALSKYQLINKRYLINSPLPNTERHDCCNK